MAEEICAEDLQGNDESNKVFCEGLWAAELGNLQMVSIVSSSIYRDLGTSG
jgi:hypothetical protein